MILPDEVCILLNFSCAYHFLTFLLRDIHTKIPHTGNHRFWQLLCTEWQIVKSSTSTLNVTLKRQIEMTFPSVIVVKTSCCQFCGISRWVALSIYIENSDFINILSVLLISKIIFDGEEYFCHLHRTRSLTIPKVTQQKNIIPVT